MASVSDRRREPTEADGPLFRAAYQRAGDIDEASTPERRQLAWGGFLRAAAVALAEGLLREAFIWIAVGFSLFAAVFGVTGGDIAWTVPMVTAGAAGVTLVFWSIFRRWSFGRQWAVLLSVTIVQIGLVVAFWRLH